MFNGALSSEIHLELSLQQLIHPVYHRGQIKTLKCRFKWISVCKY